MIIKSDNFYLVLIFTSVISSCVFCIGFFPYATFKELKQDENKFGNFSQINRTVLMIIDALRLDFMDSESFSYVHHLLETKEACLLKLFVSLPTVTKPRIKALTSGTIPSFLDVAMNFGNDEMKIDTFLHQLHRRKEKIVLAGDDTWRMFRFFDRDYANRDSLFVNDFYEGDKNVTTSLRLELKRNDWKLLILHYLGLDHIGHVEGPFSKLVPPKLKEMNDVIKLIHLKLLEWNKNSMKKSILIVTGDHGMRDTGGHSGNSFPETHIPLLMIGGSCESNRDKFYKQIDFAPTFSIMNGLPVPSSSIGSIIPEMLVNLSSLQKLSVLEAVNQRLVEMIKDSDEHEELKFLFRKAKTFHQMFIKDFTSKNAYERAESGYLESSKKISEILSQGSMDVNLLQVLLGLVLNILIAITILIPCDFATLKDVKLSFESFILFILCGIPLKFLILNEIFQEQNDFKSFFMLIIMSIALRIVIGILKAKLERFRGFKFFDNDLLYLLLLGHFFFAVSVGSSSFVEEEHQIWYYFCNTMFSLFAFFEIRGRKNPNATVSAISRCIPFLLLHVVIRRMNQTGDRWISLPDLSDWLHQDANQHWLHVSIVISLIASSAWLLRIHTSKHLIVPFVIVGNILLYFHHTRTINNRNDIPITTLFWINLCIIVTIDLVTNINKNPTKRLNFFVVFFLFSLLLHQPQNVIMPFACSVSCWFVNATCNNIIKNMNERIIAKIILHIWIGKLFYFYQGNSNSLSTIDVNAGFVGQMHVHLPIVFIFSTINTFNGQLISLFLLIIHLIEESKRLMNDSAIITRLFFKWLSILTIIPTTVFLIVITLLRHHLFIWSVFSPKLLYDFFASALMLLIMLIVKVAVKF
ncbi:CLUMA_CG015105, isoform A [Clunio marinus]|uniref:CLUMA_CG015105, isoform A n=1 Tax=Clunio marinus TaxID=568069 RepID=A0A1J1IPZ8_9DIPT|nr:CLUMA_CG015105, isoform A [Clunio marinus]